MISFNFMHFLSTLCMVAMLMLSYLWKSGRICSVKVIFSVSFPVQSNEVFHVQQLQEGDSNKHAFVTFVISPDSSWRILTKHVLIYCFSSFS